MRRRRMLTKNESNWLLNELSRVPNKRSRDQVHRRVEKELLKTEAPVSEQTIRARVRHQFPAGRGGPPPGIPLNTAFE